MTRTNQDPKPKSRRRKWCGHITRLANAERAENQAQYAKNTERFMAYTQREVRLRFNNQLTQQYDAPVNDLAAVAAGLNIAPAEPINLEPPPPPCEPDENGVWDLNNHPHIERDDDGPAPQFEVAFGAVQDDADLAQAIADGVILAEDVGFNEDVSDDEVDKIGQRLADLCACMNPKSIRKKSRAQSTFDKHQNNNEHFIMYLWEMNSEYVNDKLRLALDDATAATDIDYSSV